MLDVTVIGGGLVGASAAHRLLARGARVTVVDRCDLGQATAAGAGILPPLDHFAPAPGLLPLIRAARAHYPELLAQLRSEGEADTFYQRAGALHVATDARELEQLAELKRRWEDARAHGFPHIGDVTLLDGAAARRRVPVLGAAVIGALASSEAARVDGRRLLAALRAAVLKRGGQWLHAPAELSLSSSGSVELRVHGEVRSTETILVAAGSWSRQLVAPLGIDLPVRAQRGQLLHLELRDESTGHWPTVLGYGTHYLLGFPHGRVVVGATREDLPQHDYRATAGGVLSVLAGALELAPGLADATVLETRIGFRPVSADGLPVLGASPRVPKLFVATGHGGYGLEVGPYSGAAVADLMLGQPVTVDLAPFSAARFGSGPA